MIRLSGRFRSALIIGLQGIRSRKLRTFLSMISLFLGVLAVVAVQAGASIAERLSLSQIEVSQAVDGTRMLWVPPHQGVSPVVMSALKGRTDAVGLITTSATIGEPGVQPINQGGQGFSNTDNFNNYGPPPDMRCFPDGHCEPVQGQQQPVKPVPKGQAIELQLVALTGNVLPFRPFRPVSGDWLDFDSQPSLAPRLVLNREAAKGFSMYRVPAEMQIPGATTNPTPRFIGVVDDGNTQPTAYVRADELLTWLPDSSIGDSDRGTGLQVLMSPASHDIERVLLARLAGVGVPAGQLKVETVNIREQLKDQIAIIRWIFLGMASLVLLIGVAGILNVGLATVGERIEEFALRRAVGTPRVLLAGIVLAETLFTGLFTAGAAIGVGVLGLRLLVAVLGSRMPTLQHVEFPWQAGVAGILAGLAAGLLGGLIPALRAARIPIATVMRA